MSFLEKLKERKAAAEAANHTEETPVKANPLAALKAKKPAETTTDDANKPKNPLLARMRAKNQEQTAEKEEPKAEEKKEMSLQEKAEAVVSEKLKDTAPSEKEKKAEEQSPKEPAVEKTEEKVEDSEKVAEEKPKKRRRRKTAAQKEEKEEKEEIPADTKTSTKKQDIKVHEYVQNYDILGKKASYDDMAGAVMDYFIDDDWKATQDELTEKMNNIRIEPDMNPGTLKYAVAELNNLNDEISAVYVEQKQLLDVLTDKEFGAATALLAMNSRGANSEERKANGFAALMHAKFGGDEDVNLIALINAVKMRFVFLNSLSKRIQYKTNTCITMSGAIKMEQSLMVGAGVA